MREGLLLDTNVVSETLRTEPDLRVMSFLRGKHELWLPVIALHELEFGVRRLEPGRRRDRLNRAVSDYVARYRDRIVPLGRREAAHSAALRAGARRQGRVLRLADALIAGTAMARGLAIATRNVKDFDYLDIGVVNPWESA